jgi:hypothetical protein
VVPVSASGALNQMNRVITPGFAIPMIGVIASGLAILWFTRASKRGAKALACYVALLAWSLSGPSYTNPASPGIAFAAIYAAVLYAIVTLPLLPAVMEEIRRNRLTIAR